MSENPELLVETLTALYGDGAWEISKRLTEKEQRTQARVGLASNIVGLAAGVAGTKQAYDVLQEKRGKLYHPKHADMKPKGVKAKYAIPIAGGLLGLQVANNLGDAVANRVLSRESKKKVSKGFFKPQAPPTPPTAPEPAKPKQPIKYKLAKKGVDVTAVGAKQAPKIASKTFAAAQQAPDLIQKPVQSIRKDVDFAIRGEVSKMVTDKQQVFGWASVIEKDGEPVIDLQGDVMTIETIEKAAYAYVHGSRKGGRQHQRDGEQPLHVSDLIESIVITQEKKEALGLGPEIPTGWWVGFQVNDEDTWQQYKEGKLKEFSIHGSGTRKALEF
jgi:hypothetical protein